MIQWLFGNHPVGLENHEELFNTSFSIQSLLCTLALKAPWMVCSPQPPVSTSRGCSFAFLLSWTFCKNLKLRLGPSIDICRMRFGFNSLTAFVTWSNKSKFIECPRKREPKYFNLFVIFIEISNQNKHLAILSYFIHNLIITNDIMFWFFQLFGKNSLKKRS